MGFVVKAVKSVVKVVGKVLGSVVKVVGGIFGFSVGGKSKKTSGVNNLNKSLDPETYRKIVFGKIAAPLDVRYWEVWGTNGAKFDEVLALATHRINGVKELYLEENLAINAAGVVQSSYVGILTRDYRLGTVGQTALSVGGGQYGSMATFDSCPSMVLKWLPDEKKLPNGIPSRYTQIVEGALVYDPRRDGTQPGGFGAHRINDRSTWEYAPLDGNGQPIGRNNALQTLWYLLGWTIPTKDAGGSVTGEMLVAGRGIDPQDINISSFIAAANACEAAGYYTDMVLSTEDDHTSNEDKITCSGLIGRLIDPGGLWSYYANVNDTANIAVELTDADILQGSTVTWDEFKGMGEQFNQVRGKFIYPASPVLYQAFPYPMVRDSVYEANLGIKRAKPLDFEQVLDSVLAQRLARLFLNEGQYQGEFQAGFNYRALNAQAWSVVRYTSERFGFTKLFRVWRQGIDTISGVSMMLKEIDPSIWGAGTVTPPLAPGLGLNYQANQEIPIANFDVDDYGFIAPDGTQGDGFSISWNAPNAAVRRTEIRYKLTGTTYWTTAAPIANDGSIANAIIGPLLSGAFYDIEAWHVTVNEVPGPISSVTIKNGETGNVNLGAIEAAGGTAVWDNITGDGKPEDNATEGATIPTPGSVNPGNIKDENGTLVPPEYIRNDALALTADGIFGFRPTPVAPLTEIGRVTIADLGGVERTALEKSNKAIDRLAEATLQLTSAQNKTRNNMRDAGIIVDAATGQVRIFAVEQQASKLSEVSIRLNAAEATIISKASVTYVNEQIALAQIPESEFDALDDVIIRIGSAETRLDANEAAIISKAESTTLTALTGRVTTAEVDINALEGLVSTKVDSATVTAIDSRLSSAEQEISAITGGEASISNIVTATRVLDRETDDAATSSLWALLNADKERRNRVVAVAQVNQEIRAKIDESGAAEASQRLALAVKVAAAESAIINESSVRASGDAAVAATVSALTSRVGIAEGAITTELNTRAAADLALSGSLTTLTARVGIAESAIQTEANTRASADIATNNLITTLTSRVGIAESAIQTEQTTRANSDSAIASSVTSLNTRVGNSEASITSFQGSIDGISARAGIRLDVNNRITGWVLNNNGQQGGIDFVADYFNIWPSSGGSATAPFAFRDGVLRVAELLVDKISVKLGEMSSVVTTQIADAQYNSSTNNFITFTMPAVPSGTTCVIIGFSVTVEGLQNGLDNFLFQMAKNSAFVAGESFDNPYDSDANWGKRYVFFQYYETAPVAGQVYSVSFKTRTGRNIKMYNTTIIADFRYR